MHQLLAFHHLDSEAYIENKAHKGAKLKAQKQIHLYMEFSHLTKETWKVRAERRKRGSEKLFFT